MEIEQLLLKISANVEVLLSKNEDIKNDISYLTNMKNAHESRINTLEKSIPSDLDKRLRDIELKTYLVSTFLPLVISIAMKYILV
jgi:hypothetical protein